MRRTFFWLLFAISLVILFTAAAPLEKTLGANARIVYLHGAWVWAALGSFACAAVVGAAGFLLSKYSLHRWSRALGRTALLLWLTFLPMSLYIMQANWNGLFLDEPRWRIPFTFAVAGFLLQVGLSFFPPSWASAANLGYAAAIFFAMRGMENILHPVSPVFDSDSSNIQVFFGVLVVLLLIMAWQITRILLFIEKARGISGRRLPG